MRSRLSLLLLLAAPAASSSTAWGQAASGAPGFGILRPTVPALAPINPAPQSPANLYMPSPTPQGIILEPTAPNFRSLPQQQLTAPPRQSMQLWAPVIRTPDGADVLPPAAPGSAQAAQAAPQSGVSPPGSRPGAALPSASARQAIAQGGFLRSYVPPSQRPQSRRRPLGW